jgi:hypothetical protein
MLDISTERLTAQRVLVRDMPDRSRIVATLRISQLGGNAHPHFSATCAVYEPHGTWSGAAQSRNGRDSDIGGAAHDAILDAFPGAAAFVTMHLSDYPSGVPMHPGNAHYFMTAKCCEYEVRNYGTSWMMRHGSPLTRAANYLRCGVDEIPYDIARNAGTLTDDTLPAFDAFVDTLRPRWARQARAARELLELMPDVCDLRGYDIYGEPIDRKLLPAWLIGADPETVDV